MTTTTYEMCLTEAANRMPPYKGRRTSPRTIERWIKSGCRGVKLEGWKRGGRWFTSEAAIENFRVACTYRNPSLSVASKQAESTAVKRSMRELREAGFFGRG